MRARLTYVPLEVAERFEGFIIQRDEQVLDAVRAKTKDFSTLSLLKLLYQLNSNPMTFSDLYSKSKIRMKKSFLNYLHFCVEYKFIEKETIQISKDLGFKQEETLTFFVNENFVYCLFNIINNVIYIFNTYR